MAIRVRRGNEANFDKDKLLPGESATVLDKGQLYHAIAPGNVKRIVTEEDIEDLKQDVEEVVSRGNEIIEAADDIMARADYAVEQVENIVAEKVGINDVNPTNTQAYSGVKVEERLATKAQYTDLDSQTGTFIHTEKSEDSVAEIVKVEGKTVVTPANPDEDISPDNVAEIKSVGPCDVVSCNKNLFDKSISAKGWYDSDGEFRTSSVWYIREIPVKPNTDITFSGIAYNADPHICGRKSDGAIIPIAPVDNITINTSDYVSIIYSINQNYLDSAQVEIGSTPTDYTPHQSDKITLDVPLRENDELIYLGNGKAKYLKGDQQVVFDGSSDEDWKKSSSQDYAYFIDIPEALVLGEVLCSSYKVVANADIAKNNRPSLYNGVYQGVMRIFIFETEDAVDLSTFKNKLQSNPITIQYQLAEPIETIIDLPALKSYAGITNIYTTSEIQPAMTVNFKSRLWNDMRNKADLIDGKIPENQLPDTLTEGIEDINRTIENISKFETAGGTGTDIALTGVEFINGYSKTFIVSADNDGLPTTINGKPLYKPGTTQTPNLKTGKAVTVWYDEGNDCFFIKASAEGDAVAGDVLAGKTFSNDNDTGITGTMPNNGAINHSLPINESYTIPKGYHDGNGKVTQDIPTKEAQTYTPTTSDQTIPSGRYLTGNQIIKGDANLIPSKIPEDLTLFGIQGTRKLGKKFATGIVSPSGSQISFTLINGGYFDFWYLDVSGIGFKPSSIAARWYDKSLGYLNYVVYNELDDEYTVNEIIILSGTRLSADSYSSTTRAIRATGLINNGSFRLPWLPIQTTPSSSHNIVWEAYGD